MPKKPESSRAEERERGAARHRPAPARTEPGVTHIPAQQPAAPAQQGQGEAPPDPPHKDGEIGEG